MAAVLEISAPAKINLWLRITGRRPDGFHEIDTAMVPIELADLVRVELGVEKLHFNFIGGQENLPTDERNLAVRAAIAFFHAAGLPEKCRIDLLKRIPSEAGLGGGSSDAAAVLVALNHLHGNLLPESALRAVALSIGSDVPFFLDPHPARCTGRGEILEPLGELPPMNLLIVKPPFGVGTAWAYSAYSALSTHSRHRPASPLPLRASQPGWFENDLELPVFDKFRQLGELKRWLAGRRGVAGVAMSGSGACIYAVLNEDADAGRLREALASRFGTNFFQWAGKSRARQVPGH